MGAGDGILLGSYGLIYFLEWREMVVGRHQKQQMSYGSITINEPGENYKRLKEGSACSCHRKKEELEEAGGQGNNKY